MIVPVVGVHDTMRALSLRYARVSKRASCTQAGDGQHTPSM